MSYKIEIVWFSAFCCLAFLMFMVFIKYRRRQLVNPGVRAVLITGCDRGFGNLLAIKLDSMGYKVFAGCIHAQGDAARQLDKVTSPMLEILQLDVTKDEEIEHAREHITESLHGKVLWALVNNAGVAFHAEFEWFPWQHFQEVMDVNFLGLVKTTRAFLPLVRASMGRVVNISSMAARTALPGFTAYSASKAAVVAFSDSLRREMAHFGVKVIVLEPSVYKTYILSLPTLTAQNEAYWDQADAGIKRDYGTSFFQSTQDARKRMTMRARPNLQEVVDCLVEAVSSRHPRSRYVTPFSFRVLNDVMNSTFVAVQDYILRQVMGVWTKPAMVDPQLHAENGRQGRRRSHAS